MSTQLSEATNSFVAHRNLLFTVSYEMLGSAADAEDVLQEVWLRWATVDLARVRDHRAFLVRIAIRLSLNRLHHLRRRKESYVGPWLPESVSMAIMLVMESLAPTERAVFVLREVFDFGYAEIAQAIDKKPDAVRQIAHRARGHMKERRPREIVTPREARPVVESFRQALQTGELERLLDVLAPGVVMVADGGGIKRAAPRPVFGAEKVVRMAIGGIAKAGIALTADTISINGNPALLLRVDGEIDGVLAMCVEGRQVTGLYYVRNPDKLSRLATVTRLSR